MVGQLWIEHNILAEKQLQSCVDMILVKASVIFQCRVFFLCRDVFSMIFDWQGKEFWDLDTQEKLQFSVDAKAKGTEHFKVSGDTISTACKQSII